MKQRYVSFLLLLAFVIQAQEFPDTLWIPVIFYDFHADMSNPEFNMHNDYGVQTGMVQKNQLEWDKTNAAYFGFDSIPKPIYNPDNVRHNRYIKYWYRPWETAAKGDYAIPNYVGRSGRLALPPTRTVGHDTSFINIVIKDSLPFLHEGNGVYQFDRSGKNGASEFFWLDGRGYGDEGDRDRSDNEHNYSFTMEMHILFQKQPGLTFNFNGDDDVWVFVDGKLAMDLGGVHGPADGSFNVDSIDGLENGKNYMFSLFYAERNVVKSTIKITTNVIAPPGDLLLYPDSTTDQPYGELVTIRAGDTIDLWSRVFDEEKTRLPQMDSLVTWELIDSMGNSYLINVQGPKNSWTPTKAHGKSTIRATFTDPNDPSQKFSTELRVDILPGDPHHIDLVRDTTTTPLREDEDRLNVSLEESDENERPTDTVWAIFRDEFGNKAGIATDAEWEIDNPVIAGYEFLNENETGKARIIIYRKKDGDAVVNVTSPTVPGYTDSLNTQDPTEPVIAVGPNPFVPGKTKIYEFLEGKKKIEEEYRNVLPRNRDASGTLISLGTEKEFMREGDGYGKVRLYDALGNVVRSDLQLRQAYRGAQVLYGIFWDGLNDNGRYAGGGVYLLVVQVKENDGKALTHRIRIGVKR